MTGHTARCPCYNKHFKGPVNLVNIVLGKKKIPGERGNSSTTKYLEATKDFGINPQLIHKDNRGRSPDFFIIFLTGSLENSASALAVPKDIILFFSDLQGCKTRFCGLCLPFSGPVGLGAGGSTRECHTTMGKSPTLVLFSCWDQWPLGLN